MAELGLICRKSFNRGILHIPNFSKRADNYSKYIRRDFEECLNNVEPYKKRREENRIDKKDREKILLKYIELKGWKVASLDKVDYQRINSIINKLMGREGCTADLVCKGLEWLKNDAAGKGYTWKIDTLHHKKWQDFMANKNARNYNV